MGGLFIAFEGIDGSGKTTQIRLLKEFLESRGFECVVVREPGGTEVGERIRDILLGMEMVGKAEFFLFLASRSQLTEQVIIPALHEGKVVIADRYADSSLAYQGYGRGLDLNFVEVANRFATSGVEPDITFYIDISVKEALRRKGKKDRIEADAEFLERVRRGYMELSRKRGYVVLNGEEEVGKIQNEIREKVLEELGGDRF